MSDSEKKTVIGRCVGIMERQGGWTQFHIDFGKQYPLKLETKVQAVIDQARAFGDGEGVWHYNESDGGPNPNRPGTFYKNRYLSDVKAVTGDDRSSSTTNGGTSKSSSDEEMTKQEWDAKERRGLRSRTWAQTISAFAHTISGSDNPMDVFVKLQPFQRAIYKDITGNFAYPDDDSDLPFHVSGEDAAEAAEQTLGAYSEPDHDRPPLSDADVPF